MVSATLPNITILEGNQPAQTPAIPPPEPPPTSPTFEAESNKGVHTTEPMITFIRLKDGKKVAKKPFTNEALYNTYTAFWQTLDQMRTWMKHENREKISAIELRKQFASRPLMKVADDKELEDWISDLVSTKPKGAALVFFREANRYREGHLETSHY